MRVPFHGFAAVFIKKNLFKANLVLYYRGNQPVFRFGDSLAFFSNEWFSPQVAVERLLKMKARCCEPDKESAPQPYPSLPSAPSVSLLEMYNELYCFFGDSLAVRFGTGGTTLEPDLSPRGTQEPKKEGSVDGARKMPQLTAHGEEEEVTSNKPPQQAPPITLASASRPRGGSRQGQRVLGVREAFQKSRLAPRGSPRFTFLIGGRQAGRGGGGRRFQSVFQLHTGPGATASRYAQKLPMIGRMTKTGRKRIQTDLSLYLPL